MSKPIERLGVSDRRLLLALVSIEAEHDRRADRTANLLEAGPGPYPDGWFDEAARLISAATGLSRQSAFEEFATLARESYPVGGLVTPLDAERAALRHLDEWPRLDHAGRRAAVEEEVSDRSIREILVVIEAAMLRGDRFSAPDLHPPLDWWGPGRTNRILEAVTRYGLLRATGERATGGWAIYEGGDEYRAMRERVLTA